MTSPIRIIGIAILITFSASYAHAIELAGYMPSAPYGVFSTLSAESPREGHSAVSFLAEKAGSPEFYRYSSQLAFGVSDSVEVGVNIPYLDDTQATGMEDILFGLKHRFFDEGTYGPSVAYLLTAGMASSHDTYSVNGSLGGGLIASKRVGPFRAHVNILYAHPWDKDLYDEVRGSAGVEFSAAHNFKIMAELLERKSFYSRSLDQSELRLGYRFFYADSVIATIGAGVGVNDRAPEHRVFAALTFMFPQREGDIERVIEGN